MNFWSLSSLYIFLEADIPEYFYLILKIIYDKINSPIFNLEDAAE